MIREVTIRTGARLHFGQLSDSPASPRVFGGAGVMIDTPGWTLTARRNETELDKNGDPVVDVVEFVDGTEAQRRRVAAFLRSYRDRCPREALPPPTHVKVETAIAPHRGFGSGTQLGLAVARALATLAADPAAEHVRDLAHRAGRGVRSALGLYGFELGGFLIDAGKTDRQALGELAARAEFPDTWRFVLVTPRDESGLHGEKEQDAFAQLPGMPAATTERLCHIALTGLLPAAREADFDGFCMALDEYGGTVGEYFAPVQGGIYANARMTQLARHLRHEGHRGIAQTSWGPTLCVLARDAAAANRLAETIAADHRWSGCTFRMAAGLNCGARVETR